MLVLQECPLRSVHTRNGGGRPGCSSPQSMGWPHWVPTSSGVMCATKWDGKRCEYDVVSSGTLEWLRNLLLLGCRFLGCCTSFVRGSLYKFLGHSTLFIVDSCAQQCSCSRLIMERLLECTTSII